MADDTLCVAGSGFASRLVALIRSRWPQVAVYLFALFVIDLIRHHSSRSWSADTLVHGNVLALVLGITSFVGAGSVAGTLVAEALAWRGGARVIATVAFAVLGAAIALGGIALAAPAWLTTSWDEGAVPISAFVLRNLWYFSATSVVFSAFFATRERDVEITRAAQAAELERGRAQRIVMESRLKVMQARVEPELLFDVLTDIQRRYASSPAEAEALLEDLIVYLRAALPQMRGDSSTLAREAGLAGAFLAVTPAGRAGALSCGCRIPLDLEDMPFPPMVLLPLVHAVAEARAPRLQIDASVFESGTPAAPTILVRVVVPTTVRVPGWQGEPLTALRAIVTSYFGAESTLETVAAADGLAAVLAFPAPTQSGSPHAATGSRS